MNIKRLLIKHGPGSLGESAKTIVQVYKNIKSAYPGKSEEEIFLMTLKARRDHVKELVKYPLYEQDEIIVKDVLEADGKLSDLVFKELEYEYPILKEIEIKYPKLYKEAKEIVGEICKK